MAHILPTVSHDRILLKASLAVPASRPPRLSIGRRSLPGRPSDTAGSFWVFDVPDLEPATTYELSLHDADGGPLGEAWPLKTFPHPASSPERLRLLLFTCAGGHEALELDGRHWALPLAVRRRLLARGLSYAPDAVIANGDHVYWDQLSVDPGPSRRGVLAKTNLLAGEFDRGRRILGTPNEDVLKRAAGPQIADLYGTLLRSTPTFFLQDDHDYFEGDHVRDTVVPFPPDTFMVRAARACQWLYYPEFLPDANRSTDLPSAAMADRPAGVSESFGTLRFGRLFELLLYDCRRYQTLKGRLGTLIPEPAERWLLERMASKEVRHLVQVPSLPVGWSAGKWGEWYPDVLDEDGHLTVHGAKEFWQSGWLRQHDRLLAAASAMSRTPLFLNGDLHAIADATIRRSGEHDFSSNPIRTALTGSLGTLMGWPSAARGTPGRLSAVLDGGEELPCLEENGFTILDVEPSAMTMRFFRWLPHDRRKGTGGEERIDRLEPFRVSRLT